MAKQPVARVEVVRETHYGFTWDDPYRWMEDWHGDELKEWVTAQGQYTEEYLNNLPQREALLKRIKELSQMGGAEISAIKPVKDRFFYLRHESGEGLAKLLGLDKLRLKNLPISFGFPLRTEHHVAGQCATAHEGRHPGPRADRHPRPVRRGSRHRPGRRPRPPRHATGS